MPEPSVRRESAHHLQGLALRLMLLWTTGFVIAMVFWIPATFGEVTLGQIVFHWRHLGGAESITVRVAIDLALVCVGLPLVAALLWLWFERRVLGLPRRGRRMATAFAWLPLLLIGVSTATLAARTSALSLLGPFGGVDQFARHYLPPEQVTLLPGQRKNLVLIYVESLELSYRNEAVFGSDLLASLQALRPVSFARYHQLPGTGWTIAGIVATQCGLPLKPMGVLDTQHQGEVSQDFLPGATCLSDLLAARGYRNVFLGGASLDFSGKGKFLRGHQYDEVWGRAEWVRSGVTRQRMSNWGLYDDDLFARARVRLRELHAARQPFNLTILTVDTHWPGGNLSPGCSSRGAGNLDSIVACTAEQVAEFVAFIRREGYDANTNVVVIGDHLTPPNALQRQLDQVPQRTIYNAFFARKPPLRNRDDILAYDLLPTILDFIGLQPRRGRMGLGVSGFATLEAPLPDIAARAAIAQQAMEPSRAYARLWEPGSKRPLPAAPAP